MGNVWLWQRFTLSGGSLVIIITLTRSLWLWYVYMLWLGCSRGSERWPIFRWWSRAARRFRRNFKGSSLARIFVEDGLARKLLFFIYWSICFLLYLFIYFCHRPFPSPFSFHLYYQRGFSTIAEMCTTWVVCAITVYILLSLWLLYWCCYCRVLLVLIPSRPQRDIIVINTILTLLSKCSIITISISTIVTILKLL